MGAVSVQQGAPAMASGSTAAGRSRLGPGTSGGWQAGRTTRRHLQGRSRRSRGRRRLVGGDRRAGQGW